MKIWLDDEREAPEGWIKVRWPEDVIKYLKTCKVTELSLDHDLGDSEKNGYQVLLWLEEAIVSGSLPENFNLPEIRIHTQNPVAKERMKAALESIKEKWRERR